MNFWLSVFSRTRGALRAGAQAGARLHSAARRSPWCRCLPTGSPSMRERGRRRRGPLLGPPLPGSRSMAPHAAGAAPIAPIHGASAPARHPRCWQRKRCPPSARPGLLCRAALHPSSACFDRRDRHPADHSSDRPILLRSPPARPAEWFRWEPFLHSHGLPGEPGAADHRPVGRG